MTKPKVYDPEVPLFLIATAVAEGVRKRGGKLFRISVVRTHSHAYRIKYKCRVKGEPEPGMVEELRETVREQWTFPAGTAPGPGAREEFASMDCGVTGNGRNG
jgi:hypothetical protein